MVRASWQDRMHYAAAHAELLLTPVRPVLVRVHRTSCVDRVARAIATDDSASIHGPYQLAKFSYLRISERARDGGAWSVESRQSARNGGCGEAR